MPYIVIIITSISLTIGLASTYYFVSLSYSLKSSAGAYSQSVSRYWLALLCIEVKENIKQMKGIILALAVIAATVCAHDDYGGHGGFPSGGPRFFPKGPLGPRHHGFPLPPFLHGLDETARKEFFEIMKDHQLTFAQRKQKVEEWGKKFGVEAQVVEFHNKMKALKETVEQNVTDLIKKLPDAFQKISSLAKNEDQTPTQLFHAIKELTKEDPKVYHVLKFAFDQFMRRHHGFGSHGGPWGPRRPGGPGGFERPGFGGHGHFAGWKEKAFLN